jgi:dTDP-glucose pyrophosphorylase
MNVILICPEHRPDAGIYQRMRPLALMPVLGRTLLDHAFAHLADRGATEVLVLTSDRPEQIRSAVKAGAVWGLKINVMPTSSEPSKEDALQFYGADFSVAGVPSVIVLDAIPGGST